jgi:hypothetical protein
MDEGACNVRRRRRTWPPPAPAAAAVVGAIALALLAAACGTSPGGHVARLGSSTTLSGSASNRPAATSQDNGALAFSRCMRSNGVADYPDPGSSGAPPKKTPQQLGVSSSQFQAAQRACQHLLPNGGNGPTPAALQQMRTEALEFSRCMRTHGVTTFPDPGSDGRIPDPASFGIDQGSPQFQAANPACRESGPPYIPSNAAYNSWARTSTSRS